ncbi:hypothetical protein V7O62_08635 [Methanolobus sp. ZRKC2]|uniref:hypothetical protein n=1 Tax=Methanolobus sp. ZRKC2 TaxID=3125783 RepID=UPI003246CD6E
MRTKESKESLISPHLPLSSFEMGRDDVNVVCTYGKISIWFGRQVPDVVIGQIFLGIAKIDQAAVHELEMVCAFDEITDFESNGYVLVSYARSEDGYRTTFNVPFSSKKALFTLANSVTRELKNENAVLDCYWTGDGSDIMRLHEELSNIKGWKIKNINYKEDSKDKNYE